ncbi:hypothetical protein FUAX_39680 (plasmid) [Fulvitalea axinellae]|uniref:Uncharacterized protein n=1 Tax=Fulvitalea axinellae TaxID=1182444 RepID=A0AAU9CQU3_9BACT|nr:hypothetical protein FUAX_39680 [Fulvitalea axinellae]
MGVFTDWINKGRNAKKRLSESASGAGTYMRDKRDSFAQQSQMQSMMDRGTAAKQGVESKVNGVREGAGGMRQQASEKLSGFRQSASEKVGNMRKGASEKFSGMKQSASDRLSGMKKSAGERLSGMKQGASDRLSSMKQGAGEKFSSLRQGASDRFGSMRESLSSKTSGVSGFSPGFASGFSSFSSVGTPDMSGWEYQLPASLSLPGSESLSSEWDSMALDDEQLQQFIASTATEQESPVTGSMDQMWPADDTYAYLGPSETPFSLTQSAQEPVASAPPHSTSILTILESNEHDSPAYRKALQPFMASGKSLTDAVYENLLTPTGQDYYAENGGLLREYNLPMYALTATAQDCLSAGKEYTETLSEVMAHCWNSYSRMLDKGFIDESGGIPLLAHIACFKAVERVGGTGKQRMGTGRMPWQRTGK